MRHADFRIATSPVEERFIQLSTEVFLSEMDQVKSLIEGTFLVLKPLCGRPYSPCACSRWRLLCGQCLDLRYSAAVINFRTTKPSPGNRLAKATEHLPSRGQTIFTAVLYSISALMVK